MDESVDESEGREIRGTKGGVAQTKEERSGETKGWVSIPETEDGWRRGYCCIRLGGQGHCLTASTTLSEPFLFPHSPPFFSLRTRRGSQHEHCWRRNPGIRVACVSRPRAEMFRPSLRLQLRSMIPLRSRTSIPFIPLGPHATLLALLRGRCPAATCTLRLHRSRMCCSSSMSAGSGASGSGEGAATGTPTTAPATRSVRP